MHKTPEVEMSCQIKWKFDTISRVTLFQSTAVLITNKLPSNSLDHRHILLYFCKEWKRNKIKRNKKGEQVARKAKPEYA